MKNKNQFFLNVWELCFCLFLLLVSCEKEDQIVGIDMLPDTDLLETCVDSTSTSISFVTVKDDSVRSSLVTYMVGETYTETFGKTRAGYITRMYLQGMQGDISTYTLDSVCLRLAKSSDYAYGDTSTSQIFSIYEITKDITVDDCAGYIQYTTVPTCISSINKIMDATIPAYEDSTSLYSFKLDASYATDLYDRIQKCYDKDSSRQRFDSLFIQQFKGLYITTQNNQFNDVNAVVMHSVPGILFYLSSKDTTVTLTFAPSPQAYDSPLSTDPSQIYLQAINVYEHEYPSEISTETESTIAYAQGMLGLKTRLTLSGLESWRDRTTLNSADPILFNIAKLKIPITEWTYEYLPLNLRIYDADRNLVLSTMSLTTDSTICEFNVQSFLLYLFNHSAPADDYYYELTVPENNAYANGFVFDGTLTEKLKLIITYTK